MHTVYGLTALNLSIIHPSMYETVDMSAAIRLRAVAGFPSHMQEVCIYKLQDTGAGGLFPKYYSSFYLAKNHSRMARRWFFIILLFLKSSLLCSRDIPYPSGPSLKADRLQHFNCHSAESTGLLEIWLQITFTNYLLLNFSLLFLERRLRVLGRYGRWPRGPVMGASRFGGRAVAFSGVSDSEQFLAISIFYDLLSTGTLNI
jgi:hypothetical protein